MQTHQVLVHEDGSLILFDVNENSHGHYQCFANKSNVAINQSFYISIQNSSKHSTRESSCINTNTHTHVHTHTHIYIYIESVATILHVQKCDQKILIL